MRSLIAGLMISGAVMAAPLETYTLKGALDERSHVGASALCDTVQQYSGYYNLTTGKDKHYFYWCPPPQPKIVIGGCAAGSLSRATILPPTP